MALAPPALVTGTTRVPLPYGLFSVATPRPANERWENGVQWEPGTAVEVGAIPAFDCDSPGSIATDFTVEEAQSASSFTVYGFFHGNPVGASFEAAQAQALDHLVAREEARVEQALWTGDLGNTPSLAGTAVELDSGTANNYAKGLGLLEQTVAQEYGSLGVIHMTRQMALIGLGLRVLESRSNRLYTALGTPVVAGAGYDGTDTDGVEPSDGQSWVYATPPLFFYRGEPVVGGTTGEFLDRSDNTLYAVAERTYVLGFDDTVYTVLLTMEDA